jgi:RHS repeat-associated protein
MLHSLDRTANVGAVTADRYVFYFGSRPVASMELAGGSAAIQYLSVDHLGTPVQAADFAGGSVWAGGFEPFGRDWLAGTPNGAQGSGVFLRFPGQWFEETWEGSTVGAELVYNVHRWYESQTGRYTRPDPLGVLPPERNAVNLYLYALASPIRAYDPLGLDEFTDDTGVQDCMYCVFAKAGFGHRNIEEGFWLQCDGTKYTCALWPSTKSQGDSSRTTTSTSPRPTDACGIFHTHPRGKEAQPSDCRGCDIDIAESQRLPIYSIHPSGIWKYDPSTDQTTQELGRKWFKELKRRCKKPCEGIE